MSNISPNVIPPADCMITQKTAIKPPITDTMCCFLLLLLYTRKNDNNRDVRRYPTKNSNTIGTTRNPIANESGFVLVNKTPKPTTDAIRTSILFFIDIELITIYDKTATKKYSSLT